MAAEVRNKVIPAAWVFLLRGNKVLLAKRANTGWNDGFWSLPSGHVEHGESYSAAIIREAKEEVGVIIEPSDLVHVAVVGHPSSKEGESDRIDVFFETTVFMGEPENLELNKCSEIAWFSLDNLPDKIVQIVKTVLKARSEGVAFIETGWVSS